MNIDNIIREEIKNHNHSGVDSLKINASNVDINSSGCEYVKSSKVNRAIKDLDNAVKNVGDKIKPGKQNQIAVYNEKGQLISNNVNINEVAKVNHIHEDYIKKISGVNKHIVTIMDGNVCDSGINIADIKKIKKVLQNINKLEVDANKVLIADAEGNIIGSNIDINNIENKNHRHNEYVLRVSGNDELPILKKSGKIENSGVSIDNIVLRKDLINNIAGRVGDILIRDKDGEISNSGINLSSISKEKHIHKISDVSDFDLDILLSKSKVLQGIIKRVVEETVKKMFAKL